MLSYTAYVFISILVYGVLVGIIGFLISALWRKRQIKIKNHNKNETEKEIINKRIDNLTDEKLKELDDESKKAHNFSDIQRVLIDKLFN